ncbi:MAG: PEGA domain-containing protein [Myxococcota bacterium]
MNRAILVLVACCALSGVSKTAEAQRRYRVNIQSTPPGASVHLDDPNAPALGVTPLRRVRIVRGQHRLIFKLANHEDATLDVNIRRSNETFRATLQALGTITINAMNEGAQGAQARIDGAPAGPLPVRQTVQPGRHMITIEREGYVTFSQWVEVAGAQVLTLPVALEREAPETGSLLVAADVSGAAIYIDGEPRGSTPTVIDGLTAGEHAIEIRPNDTALQPHTATVRIVAGERAVVNASLRPAPAAGGQLRVLVSAPGAEVFLDGEPLGAAPASAENVTPGDHIVEVRAEGYQPAQQPVSIEAGQQRVISVNLEQVVAPLGRIVVNADVAGAVVTIDGEELGAPPVVIDQAPAGTHAVLVRAQGYQEFRHTCETGPGRSCEVTAQMRVVGRPVRVTSNVTGAELYIDGELQGPVPYEGDVPVGAHLVEVRRDGYRAYEAQISFAAGNEPRLLEITLVEVGQLTPEEAAERQAEQRERHRQAVARSGATLPDDLAVLDASVGWPYLFELRLGIGIFDWLEAGIGLRTFGRLTEFEGRVKAGFRPVRQFSAGLQVRFGGGIGPNRDASQHERDVLMGIDPTADAPSHPTNSFYTSIEALVSLHFLNAGNFTLWSALDIHSDRWDWAADDNNCRYANCCVPGSYGLPTAAGVVGDFIDGRQTIARFRIGGSLEFILTRTWNLWGSFEGVFGDPRRVLGDVFGGGNEDLQLYARLGITFKFDYVDRDDE